MSTNLVIKTLGSIQISSGEGSPFHDAPIGSAYTDTLTGKSYLNKTGTGTGWEKILKDQKGSLTVNNNTLTSVTATNSWTKISANGQFNGSSTFTYSSSQVLLISSTGVGGFENTITTGTQGFADNGWVVLNGAQSNQWYVGTTGASGSGFGAYISNNLGASNAYSIASASVVYFYRDFTVPAYITRLNLSFSIRTTGQSAVDYVRVYQLPTSQTITPGTILANTVPGYLAEYSVITGYATQTITFTLNPSASTQTRRLTFAWRNDAATGTQPPASIDRIQLSYESPLTITYTGSQSYFRSLLTGSFQSSTVANITNVGAFITKNDATASNVSEVSYNLDANNRKDSFYVQNIFTMSNGDTISPFINNKVSSVGVIVNDLNLGIWEIPD